MYEDCTGIYNWFNCLNCRFLTTNLCPLEGENVVDKVKNRLKIMDDPDYDGFGYKIPDK